VDALTSCPPWLTKKADALLSVIRTGRLHHALLLTGIEGIGKHLFAQWLCEALLCSNLTEQGACGNCDSCRQLLAEANPEYTQLVPEGAASTIRIDAVRELVSWLQLTPSSGGYRVAFISQADSLNHASANSLLKTLEEPADNAILVLSASRVGKLPATICSRCQQIHLDIEDSDAAIKWLADRDVSEPEQALLDAGHAPLRAAANQQADYQQNFKLMTKAWSDLFLYKGSVGRIADSLSDLATADCLSVFASWCVVAVKQAEGVSVDVNRTVGQLLGETQPCLTNEQWFTLHARLLQLHRSDSASFKTKPVLEGLFADIRRMINR
jgi:DNA polymerase-3 subunit delta'